MAHLHRFYLPEAAAVSGEAALPPEEAHHALHVVRLREGQSVTLFDGRGTELDATVARLTRREVFLAVQAKRSIPALPWRLTLVQGWLKADKAVETLIRRGTELGVTRFCFFRAIRSERAPRPSAKWDRWAVDACKQCGRAWLPGFAVAPDLPAALEAEPGDLLVATKARPPVPLGEAVAGREVRLLVGPEGDLADEELALAERRGGRPISLGAATFRAEVAAALAAALVLYELGALGPRGGP